MSEQNEKAQEPEWVRRRRLAAVFGDDAGDTTRDDREDAADMSRAPRGESAGDRWLREQVPPHHG